jgi:hypothetical protein
VDELEVLQTELGSLVGFDLRGVRVPLALGAGFFFGWMIGYIRGHARGLRDRASRFYR